MEGSCHRQVELGTSKERYWPGGSKSTWTGQMFPVHHIGAVTGSSLLVSLGVKWMTIIKWCLRLWEIITLYEINDDTQYAHRMSHADPVWETSSLEVACAASKLEVDISFTHQPQLRLRNNKEQEINLCCCTIVLQYITQWTQIPINPVATFTVSALLCGRVQNFCSVYHDDWLWHLHAVVHALLS